jgi:hypothetical protein
MSASDLKQDMCEILERKKNPPLVFHQACGEKLSHRPQWSSEVANT